MTHETSPCETTARTTHAGEGEGLPLANSNSAGELRRRDRRAAVAMFSGVSPRLRLAGGAAGARRLLPAGKLRSTGPVTALAVLVIAFTLAHPAFASLSNIRAILETSAVPMVAAVGLTLIVVMGAIDLSVEGVMAAAGMALGLLVANTRTGASLGAAGLALAVGVGGVFGLASGLLHTRLRIPSFMATLGVWYVGLGLATVLLGAAAPTVTDGGILHLAKRDLLGGLSLMPVIALGAIGVGYVIQRFTRLGRYAYAIGGSEANARQAGINVNRFKVAAFVFAGLMYGLAGSMATITLGTAQPNSTSGYLFSTISAVVIGGTPLTGGQGGVLQTIVGVLFVGVLNNGLISVGVSPFVSEAVQGVIIVAVVVATSGVRRDLLKVVK